MPALTDILKSTVFETARAVLRDTDERTVADMCTLTGIAAPSHHEQRRAEWFAEQLRALGLEPEIDGAGNVIAHTPAADPEAGCVAVMSHLDTVFGLDTSLEITRNGTRYEGPGISDNARGLAGILALGRALHATGWPTAVPVAFVGSTGEEGAGDLRGVKHYIAERRDRISSFIALDGAGAARIINAGVGSRRLRVAFTGPGGHSWSDFGTPNAIHACASAISALSGIALPVQPRTTLSVGRIGGGTSINAIPAEAWFELDMRSEELEPLQRLEESVRDALEAARAAASNERGQVQLQIEVFGDRPAGRTDVDHALVQSALAATRVIGLEPQLASSSTDANVPMAAQLPAIAIGAGGDAGGTHTLNEWYDNRGGVAGLERALLIVLAAAGLR